MNEDQHTTIYCTIFDLLTLQEQGTLDPYLDCTLRHLMGSFPDIAGRVRDDIYTEKHDI